MLQLRWCTAADLPSACGVVLCRLLEQGNHAGLTALHYAVYCDRLEVAQQLIAHNADIAAQAEFPDLDWAAVNAGDTCMHIAASKGNIEMIQILLRAYVSSCLTYAIEKPCSLVSCHLSLLPAWMTQENAPVSSTTRLISSTATSALMHLLLSDVLLSSHSAE